MTKTIMPERRYFVVHDRLHLMTKASLSYEIPAEDVDETWNSMATAAELESCIEGLTDTEEIAIMVELVTRRRSKICLTAEDMLKKAQPGTRFSVGFRSMIEITANDGESITYIDDDGYTVTSTREDMQKAFEVQNEKNFCRYIPILVE